jgi:hypothetical protein
MRFPLFFCFGFFLLSAVGCSTTPERQVVSDFKGVLPRVMDNDEGLLHGIELGMSKEEVSKHVLPGDSLSDSGINLLEFEDQLDSSITYFYECHFDEKGLKSIILMIYLTKENSAAVLFSDFKTYFTKKYGSPDDIGVGYTWDAPKGKRPAKIQLEEPTGYLYGVLQITFLDRDFSARPASNDTLVSQ